MRLFFQFIHFAYTALLIFSVPLVIILIPSIVFEITGIGWVMWFYLISFPIGIGTLAFIGENPELFFKRYN